MRCAPESLLRSTVSRLIDSCQPLDQNLISHAIIIYSAARSSPLMLDLRLLSPAISTYSAMRCAPESLLRSTVSRLISDYQPLYQHLSTTLSAPVSRLNSDCQSLDHHLISCRISAYSTDWSVPVSHFISTCQPVYQHLSPAGSAPVSCLIMVKKTVFVVLSVTELSLAEDKCLIIRNRVS